MKIKCYAKVNLFLKVFKKEELNNLHDIYSFFQLYKGIYDLIEIKESDVNEIKYFNKNVEIQIEDCILKKTLFFLENKFSIKKKYFINVFKKIPIGSGLGGASSNAAAVVKYILKNESINHFIISDFIKLGSDVPFFLSNYNNGLVTNYGKTIEKFNNPKIQYKIFLSGIKCETKKIYKVFDNIPINNSLNFKNQLLYLYDGSTSSLENDLQNPCFLEHKKLKKHYELLSREYIVRLSGSGSTLLLYKKDK